MIIVSDTSPITNLLSIGMILRKLYHKVIILEKVNRELRVTHTDLPEFIKVDYIKNKTAVKKIQKELDYGEAEAIILAKEKKAELLLIDEKLGRKIANEDLNL